MFYIQYDEQGNIGATVTSGTAPVHPRQLVYNEPVDIKGKYVNPETNQLEDDIRPIPEPEPELNMD